MECYAAAPEAQSFQSLITARDNKTLNVQPPMAPTRWPEAKLRWKGSAKFSRANNLGIVTKAAPSRILETVHAQKDL